MREGASEAFLLSPILYIQYLKRVLGCYFECDNCKWSTIDLISARNGCQGLAFLEWILLL